MKLIYNVILVDSHSRRSGWTAFDDGVITAVGSGEAPESVVGAASEKIDAEGGFLIPGLADTHVHFREPGLEYKGDMLTESRAAAAGGVTIVFDMPNTVPATTTVEALAAKQALAASKNAPCRIIPLLGVVPGAMEQLKRLDVESTPAVKMFLGTSTGAMACPEGRELEDIFRFLSDTRIPLIVHAEDNDIIARNTAAAVAEFGSMERIPVDRHSVIRSHEACLRSAARAVEMACRFNTRLHIAHVSTAREARELLEPGAAKGKLVTAETTPLYLDPVLCDPSRRSPLWKVNPAIKLPEDREALLEALASDRIDTIGTDHAPHLLEEKLKPGLTAASGAPSVQFALPMMLEYLQPEIIVRKMNAAPGDIFGLSVAEFTPGSPADFVLVCRTPEYTITNEMVLSRCGWTPFAGRTAHYAVAATWRDGEKVYQNGGF